MVCTVIISDLARPVSDRVFFAGEACNRHFPATVHGAYSSGLRTAGLIQAMYNEYATTQSPVISS